MITLVPCEGCARHLRAGETCCPFCGRARVAHAPREPRRIVGPITRAAILYGASVLSACADRPLADPAPAEPPRPLPVMQPVGDRSATQDELQVAAEPPSPPREPEPAAEARAERSDAEGRKWRALRAQQVGFPPPHPPDWADRAPYGAPPIDFVV